MRDDIANFSQALNYVLLHATKPGSEAHSVIRQAMRQSNGFKSWRQLQLHFAGGHRAQHFSLLRRIMQPSWNSDTRQFTRSSTTSGWKTSTDANQRTELGQSTIM
eukprot:3178206-Amphidinium_carterae.4